MKIELENVAKRYRREWILRKVNLVIESGSSIAIEGPNGSGKSTLLRMLSGHLTPSKGKISYSVQGSPVPLDEVYRHLSYAAPYIDLRRTPLSHDTQRAMRTRAEAALLALRVRSQAREAWHGYATAHAVASLMRDRVLPLTAEFEDDMLLRYNGMLKSTWDLIDATRERVAAESAALQTQRDFWLAHINLQAVLAGAEHVGGGSAFARNTRGGAAGGH